jgi:serine/threonine protein phosphatase PrpC
MAHIRRNHLHIANVGDSSCVLGFNNQGNLTSRQISRSHTVENSDEVYRIRAEHPISEFNSILKGLIFYITLKLLRN